MQCVRPDLEGGGSSLLIDIHSIYASLEELADSATIEILRHESVPWQIGDYVGGGVAWAPILTDTTVRCRRYLINCAIAQEGIKLSDSIIKALDTLDRVLMETDRKIEFPLEEGDFLIMDNKKCLHARTAISNPNSKRLMLRSWIQSVKFKN